MTHHDAHHHGAGSQEGQLALNRPLVDDHVLPVKLAVHLSEEVLQVVAFGPHVHLNDVLHVEAAADDAVLLVAVVLYQVVNQRNFVVFCVCVCFKYKRNVSTKIAQYITTRSLTGRNSPQD